MYSTSPSFPPACTLREQPFPFELVVAYEDDIMRSRAVSLYEEIEKECGKESKMRFSWWKFQFLHDPVLLERAVHVATQADMIIVALREGREPPWIARKWIDKWLERKPVKDGALVALVDGDPSALPADIGVLAYLSGIAELAQMSFFPHIYPAATSDFVQPFTGVPARETVVKPLVQDLLRSSTNASLWGINEY